MAAGRCAVAATGVKKGPRHGPYSGSRRSACNGHVPDHRPERSLAPRCRCAADGSVSSCAEHRYNPFGRIAHEVIGSFFPADPPRFYELPFSYNLIDPIKESLIAAGLDGIEISVVRQHRSVVDFSTFARGLVFGSPVFDQIHQLGSVEPTQIQEAVATTMRQEFGGEPGVMSIQAIVFEAQKPSAPVHIS
jgi:hypothetical protein